MTELLLVATFGALGALLRDYLRRGKLLGVLATKTEGHWAVDPGAVGSAFAGAAAAFVSYATWNPLAGMSDDVRVSLLAPALVSGVAAAEILIGAIDRRLDNLTDRIILDSFEDMLRRIGSSDTTGVRP